MIIQDPKLIRENETPKDVIWVSIITDNTKSQQRQRCVQFARRIARARGYSRASTIERQADSYGGTEHIEYRYCFELE